MAEIHPNDIGLATFEDVGDVEKLRTEAKKVVEPSMSYMKTAATHPASARSFM